MIYNVFNIYAKSGHNHKISSPLRFCLAEDPLKQFFSSEWVYIFYIYIQIHLLLLRVPFTEALYEIWSCERPFSDLWHNKYWPKLPTCPEEQSRVLQYMGYNSQNRIYSQTNTKWPHNNFHLICIILVLYKMFHINMHCIFYTGRKKRV